MDFEIKIGEQSYKARLPLFPRRYLLVAAHADAAPHPDMSDGEAQDLAYVQVAAIGLCWADEPLDCPSFRDCDRDIIDYGESVLDALIRLGHDAKPIMAAAREALRAVYASLPSGEAIEEATAPFAAPEGLSTVST